MTRNYLLAMLGSAVLTLSSQNAPALRLDANCRTADAFQSKLSSWITHTVRDNSTHAERQRILSGLPNAPTASVSASTDGSVCNVAAMRFAATAPSRDTVTVADVSVYAVDSTFYVVTDFNGGPAEPLVKVNADSTLTLNGGERWMDALTINRTTGVAVLWRWVYLPELETPYDVR